MPPRYLPPHERYISKVTDEIAEKFGPMIPMPNSHHAYFGPSMIGKTSALKGFISTFYKGVYDRIIVFNPSVRLEGWEDFGIPEEDFIDDITLPKVEETFKQVFKDFEESEYKKATMIIFDDFGSVFKGTGSSKKYTIFKDLIVARKKFCSCVFVCQDGKQLPPSILQQIYTVSIAPVFLETKSLERQLGGFPGIELTRKKTTRANRLTAVEAQQAVIDMNKINDNPYGRLFYYLKYPDFVYQETKIDEHVETIDGTQQTVIRYHTELTPITAEVEPGSDEESGDEIEIVNPPRRRKN